MSLNKHIILIGFKHSGKSIIGYNLAENLQLPFIDLDHIIEETYAKKFNANLNCRSIMQKEGIGAFRLLETQALSQILSSETAIISLGGGTPISPVNQQLIKSHTLVHIISPKGIVYERIVIHGRPAFISPEEDLFESFERLWNERMQIYTEIEDFSILNDKSVQESVAQIMRNLELREAQ